MEQIYRIYICSTYKDLVEERKVVANAILNLKQIPLGVEHSIASSQSPFDIMKRFIDESDCIILLLGQRYGTIYNNDVSYIEAAYNYTLEKNKPILCLLKNIDDTNIPKDLKRFRKRLLKTKVLFWNNVDDLETRIYTYLTEWTSEINLESKYKKSNNRISLLNDNEIIVYQENLKDTLGLYSTRENNDIIGLMINNLSEIKQFYKLTKDQAENAYKLAKNSSIAGIGLIIAAILIALFFNNNQIAIATTIGGTIVEVLAGTSLFVYQKTLKQLNYYYASLHNNERFLSLINIVGKTNIKDELYREIVESELDNLKQYEIKNRQ